MEVKVNIQDKDWTFSDSLENIGYKQTGSPTLEEEIKFETYRYYLKSIVNHTIDKHGTSEKLIKNVFSGSKLQGTQQYDLKYIDRFWGSGQSFKKLFL